VLVTNLTGTVEIKNSEQLFALESIALSLHKKQLTLCFFLVLDREGKQRTIYNLSAYIISVERSKNASCV